MSGAPRLTDGVIVLDGLTEADAPAHTAGEDDEHARRFGWYPRRSTEEGVRQAIRGWGDEWATGAPRRTFAMRDAETGVLAGGCEIRIVRGEGTAEMSYWTFPAWRRRGLATRAVRLACAWAFAELGMSRMELQIEPDNVASRRVAEAAGFREEGLMRGWGLIGGERRDMVLYARLAADPTL